MTVRPIRSDDDYRLAMGRVESLMDLDSPTRDQKDEIELLALVIEAYERRTTSIGPPSPIEAIKFRMEQLGLTAADVAPYLGGRTRVIERPSRMSAGMPRCSLSARIMPVLKSRRPFRTS